MYITLHVDMVCCISSFWCLRVFIWWKENEKRLPDVSNVGFAARKVYIYYKWVLKLRKCPFVLSHYYSH